jgi:hypothetical protein
MSITPVAVDVLPDSVQISLRVPVMLLALAGVVLALVAGRRLGALAAVFGAIGSGLLLVDQIVDATWVPVLNALAKDANSTPDEYATTTNLYTVADIALITIGAAFLVFAFFVRRPADRKAAPGYLTGSFATPGFPPAGQQQPAGFVPPGQGYAPPAPGYPAQPGYLLPPGAPAQPGAPGQPGSPAQPGYGAPPGYPTGPSPYPGSPSAYPGSPSGYPGSPPET